MFIFWYQLRDPSIKKTNSVYVRKMYWIWWNHWIMLNRLEASNQNRIIYSNSYCDWGSLDVRSIPKWSDEGAIYVPALWTRWSTVNPSMPLINSATCWDHHILGFHIWSQLCAAAYLGPAEKGMKAKGSLLATFSGRNRSGLNSCKENILFCFKNLYNYGYTVNRHDQSGLVLTIDHWLVLLANILAVRSYMVWNNKANTL